MAISANVAAAKKDTPIFPSKLFPMKGNKPNTAKLSPNNPLAYNPKLKRGPVMPGIMPKSLRALFSQLNFGKDAIAIKMQTNASIGADIPVVAPFFALYLFYFLAILCSSSTFMPTICFKNFRCHKSCLIL